MKAWLLGSPQSSSGTKHTSLMLSPTFSLNNRPPPQKKKTIQQAPDMLTAPDFQAKMRLYRVTSRSREI